MIEIEHLKQVSKWANCMLFIYVFSLSITYQKHLISLSVLSLALFFPTYALPILQCYMRFPATKFGSPWVDTLQSKKQFINTLAKTTNCRYSTIASWLPPVEPSSKKHSAAKQSDKSPNSSQCQTTCNGFRPVYMCACICGWPLF